MQQQIALPGFDESPAVFSLFFALFPDPVSANQIAVRAAGWQKAHALGGSLMQPSRLHVSLHGLGEYSEMPHNTVDRAKAAAQAVTLPAFDLVLDQVLTFAHQTLVLQASDGAPGVIAFERNLTVAMAKQGLRSQGVSAPHMTLAHRCQSLAQQAIEPVRWRVAEFALIYSHVGKTVHECLGRWPLGAAKA